MKDYQIDGNKEMVAMGFMNVVGSMTSCYVATGEKRERKMYQNKRLVRLPIIMSSDCVYMVACRFVLSISRKLHGWLPNYSFQHCDVHCSIPNSGIPHPTFQIHSKRDSVCYHHKRCDQSS